MKQLQHEQDYRMVLGVLKSRQFSATMLTTGVGALRTREYDSSMIGANKKQETRDKKQEKGASP